METRTCCYSFVPSFKMCCPSMCVNWCSNLGKTKARHNSQLSLGFTRQQQKIHIWSHNCHYPAFVHPSLQWCGLLVNVTLLVWLGVRNMPQLSCVSNVIVFTIGSFGLAIPWLCLIYTTCLGFFFDYFIQMFVLWLSVHYIYPVQVYYILVDNDFSFSSSLLTLRVEVRVCVLLR